MRKLKKQQLQLYCLRLNIMYRTLNVVMHFHTVLILYSICIDCGDAVGGLTILQRLQGTTQWPHPALRSRCFSSTGLKVSFTWHYSEIQSKTFLLMTKYHIWARMFKVPEATGDRINHQCFCERRHFKVLNNPELGLTLKKGEPASISCTNRASIWSFQVTHKCKEKTNDRQCCSL